MSTPKRPRLGEFELIAQIQQQAGSAGHLLKGIGDDCAVLRTAADRELLTSTDLLIEGIHFDRRWTTMEQLGRKSVAVNVSDIAAMGGTPKSLLLGVARSANISDQDLQEFMTGFIAEAHSYKAVLAGGDTSSSPGPLMISVTVLGEVPAGRAVYRSGAKPGDAIYVSGTLGDSALGLFLQQQGQLPAPELARAHHTPRAQVVLGQQLAEQQLASAMLDLSDGLLGDMEHILQASKVAAELQLADIPLSAVFRTACEKDPDLLDLALSGGEDYQLLLTSPEQQLDRLPEFSGCLTRIGRICSGTGVSIKKPDGSIYQCSRLSFDHFS